MRFVELLLTLLSLASADAGAGTGASTDVVKADGTPRGAEGIGVEGVGGLAVDTLIVRDLSAPRLIDPPGLGPGRRARTIVRLGLREIPVVVSGFEVEPLPRFGTFRPRTTPPPLRDPRAPPETLRRTMARRLQRRLAEAPLEERTAFLPPPDPPLFGEPSGEGDFLQQYTDLGMRIRGRAEIDGDWLRFRPCQNPFQETCQPALIPLLQPDLALAVQVQGTILDRVTVDVDFDQLREFGTTNTLSVLYEGRDDEIVQRLEVGDVAFDLPRSRFLTRGIPAQNFGFQMDGQFGPVDFSTVWAEQRGDLSSREFRLTGVGNERRFVQRDTLVLDDADYARGQFFFLLDPRELTDYPHIDVLQLDASSASPGQIPGVEPIQLYRFDSNPSARQQVEGYIQADAVAGTGEEQVVESGWFRPLVPGQEYYVHPSGLWIGLRAPLTRDELLAVTYISATGDTIGDYNPERIYNEGGRPRLRLLHASRGNHQPGRATWEFEMHQVYRISASTEVDPASVGVTISLGQLSAGRTFRRAPNGNDLSWLQIFGLDRESPLDRVDPGLVYTPGDDLFQDPPVVPGTFLVFPTLEPFRAPPPSPGLGLSAEDARELLGPDANAPIYLSPDPFERDNNGLFRITVPYETRSEGVISSFSLGAIGIRPASERLFLGQRPLLRDIDYRIDYDVGLVTLLNPESLFAADPDGTIRASWEQQQLFRVAPTSVVGMNATVGDDERGRVDLVALHQAEQTLLTRPLLGLEPAAVTLGGLSGSVERPVRWLDGLLSRLPGLRTGAASSFRLDGELALSLPTPNRQDRVFLDDFDASDARRLSLLERDWIRGSAPTDRTGAEAFLPLSLDASDLGEMTWQHTWIVESPEGDSIGIHEGFLPREEVDNGIQVAGTRVRDQGLRLTFRKEGIDGRAWSSITTVLSPTGTDLTNSDFLEFYATGGSSSVLVLDLGSVSEDVPFATDEGATAGFKENGVPWGLGLLDQEADPARGQVWGNVLDRIGVWGESCEGDPGQIFRLGDPRVNCTRNNGRNDTEDLDGDGNLDTAERSLRYVVRLDGTSPFLVRRAEETGTSFQLYRIPIQGGGVAVNGPFTEADLRGVKQLRLTVVSEEPANITLARMRILGSRWIRRTRDGILRGIIGDTIAPAGRVEVGPVSLLADERYVSPPGVLEQLADPTAAVGGQGLEFNERALAVSVEGIEPGDRAEVYTRFPQRPRNFLAYREARLWVVPSGGGWGEGEDVTFFFKVGTDADNFYLFQTPLRAPPPDGSLSPADWLPEVVVDFDEFLDLRRRAEETLVLQPPGPGEGPVTIWARDSTYAVVLSDRGRAPDLANVREISFGVWNRSVVPFDGEVWINELRLGRGVQDAGVAGVFEASLLAGDVVETRMSLTRRGAQFQQLGEVPSFQTDQALSITTLARLDRLMPASWGVEVPLSVAIDRSTIDPTFLNNSDVRADRIRNLREIGDRQSRVSVGFRKATPTANPILGAFLDGFDANLSTYRSRSSSVAARFESDGLDVRAGYTRRLEPREIDVVPDGLEGLVRRLLPGPIGEQLADARLRWSPESFSVGASYQNEDNRIFRFERIIEGPVDSLVAPLLAPREQLRSVAELVLRPFERLTADLSFLSQRDLLEPTEVVADPRVQALLEAERTRVAGVVNVGWETRRLLRTRVDWRPRLWSWLEHDVTWTTRYEGERNPSFIQGIVTPEGDSALALQRSARGERNLRGRVALDVGGLTRASRAAPGSPLAAVGWLRPVTLDWEDGIFSRFDRDVVDPDARFQFGWLGRNGFRTLQGDTAATLVDRNGQRWSTGVRAPGVTLDLGYGRSETATLDVRADRTTTTRAWPELRARANGVRLPRRWAAVVTRLDLSSGVTRTRRRTVFGAVAQTREQEDLTIPWDLTLGWVGSVVTGYRGTVQRGDGFDPTGATERDRTNHVLSFRSAFLPPFGLGARVERPVQTTVSWSYTAERECRTPVASEEMGCVPFVDQLARIVSLTLDTSLDGFELGVQASWTDRQSFIGQRRGSTQFQLGVFGQFLIEAGRFGAREPIGFAR